MRIPRLPPAVIAPADRRGLYPALIIVGAAMIPTTATVAPTVPAAMPKMVAVTSTAT
jgi:hypothetical protein